MGEIDDPRAEAVEGRPQLPSGHSARRVDRRYLGVSVEREPGTVGDWHQLVLGVDDYLRATDQVRRLVCGYPDEIGMMCAQRRARPIGHVRVGFKKMGVARRGRVSGLGTR